MFEAEAKEAQAKTAEGKMLASMPV